MLNSRNITETYIFKGLNPIVLLLSFGGLTTTSCITATRASRSPMSRLAIALASPDGRSRRKSYYDTKNNIASQPIGVNPRSSIRMPSPCWLNVNTIEPSTTSSVSLYSSCLNSRNLGWMELVSSLYCHVIDMRALWHSLEGYKLCKKIGKALKTRSEAIRTALNQYNATATKLTPPHPPLSWASVLKAVTVTDFNLLHDTRSDIQSLPWTEPSHWEATGLYFGIKRAHEEVTRLNVEIKHLLMFMLDTHVDYYRAICANIIVDQTVAQQLSIEWEYQDHLYMPLLCINTRVLPKSLHNAYGTNPTTQKNRVLPWCRGWLELVIGFVGWAGRMVDMPRVPDERAGWCRGVGLLSRGWGY